MKGVREIGSFKFNFEYCWTLVSPSRKGNIFATRSIRDTLDITTQVHFYRLVKILLRIEAKSRNVYPLRNFTPLFIVLSLRVNDSIL